MIEVFIEDCHHKCAIKEENAKFLNFVYAHGKLHRKADGDLLNEIKGNQFDKRRVYNGAECIAVLPNGKQVPALLFFWHTIKIRTVRRLIRHETIHYRNAFSHGLVVAKSDTKAVEFAKKAFNERRDWV